MVREVFAAGQYGTREIGLQHYLIILGVIVVIVIIIGAFVSMRRRRF